MATNQIVTITREGRVTFIHMFGGSDESDYLSPAALSWADQREIYFGILQKKEIKPGVFVRCRSVSPANYDMGQWLHIKERKGKRYSESIRS